MTADYIHDLEREKLRLRTPRVGDQIAYKKAGVLSTGTVKEIRGSFIEIERTISRIKGPARIERETVYRRREFIRVTIKAEDR